MSRTLTVTVAVLLVMAGAVAALTLVLGADEERSATPPMGALRAGMAVDGAAGPPVAVVWRTGREVRGAAADGSSARRIARLDRAVDALPSPSPDGRHIALVAGGRLLVVDVADGGAVRDLGATPAVPELLRWSPDGRRVAVLDDRRLTVCDASGDPGGCDRRTGRVWPEFGATWSPDGRAVAVIVEGPRRDGEGIPTLVTVRGGATRTVERFTPRGDRVPYPLPPVWTRAGLTWTVLDTTMEGGGLSGVGGARVRRQEGTAVRTLLGGSSGVDLRPFQAAGETLDGALLGVRQRLERTASTYALLTLKAGGRPREAGVPLGTYDGEGDQESIGVLGTVADGRIAVAIRPADRPRVRLHLATVGRGLGRVVREADEVGAATVRAGNPAE